MSSNLALQVGKEIRKGKICTQTLRQRTRANSQEDLSCHQFFTGGLKKRQTRAIGVCDKIIVRFALAIWSKKDRNESSECFVPGQIFNSLRSPKRSSTLVIRDKSFETSTFYMKSQSSPRLKMWLVSSSLLVVVSTVKATEARAWHPPLVGERHKFSAFADL